MNNFFGLFCFYLILWIQFPKTDGAGFMMNSSRKHKLPLSITGPTCCLTQEPICLCDRIKSETCWKIISQHNGADEDIFVQRKQRSPAGHHGVQKYQSTVDWVITINTFPESVMCLGEKAQICTVRKKDWCRNMKSINILWSTLKWHTNRENTLKLLSLWKQFEVNV